MGFIRYEMTNIEMLSINDKQTSQEGQTSTLSYIPGSSIRGIIVNLLAQEDGFEEIKKELLSGKVRFLDVIPSVGGKEGMVPIKGFYEDKSKDTGIESVLIDGEVKPGMKRAGLGHACRVEGDTIQYAFLSTTDSMNIAIGEGEEKSKIFRQNYISKNQKFVGYIYAEDEVLEKKIADCLKEQEYVYIGNNRSTGHGKCKITAVTNAEPWSPKEVKGECYLVLSSAAVLRNGNGEYSPLAEEYLQQCFGVADLTIQQMSSSTTNVCGYNQVWGGAIPAVTMYEAGTAFHLSFEGSISADKLRKVMEKGIGERKNEGFGQVRIFEKDEFEAIRKKELVEYVAEYEGELVATREDEQVLRVVARRYLVDRLEAHMDAYVLEHVREVGFAKNSLYGQVLAICNEAMYVGGGKEKLKGFLEHLQDKNSRQRVHSNVQRSDLPYVSSMLAKSFEQLFELKDTSIMGIPVGELLTPKEKEQYHMQLISRLLKFKMKQGKKGGRA